MHKAVCVYSASSNAVAPHYFDAATEIGRLLAHHQITLIYGGGKVGLMGATATAVHRHGGKVIGVIPHYLRHQEIAYEAADELIVTKDLRERKAIMESRADAFVALPGGFGTLEEILEVLTLKQLQQHTKPVVFLNTDGFYDPLIELFERLFRERFTKAEYREFYHVAKTPAQVFDHLKDYQPVKHTGKWF